MSTIYEPDKRRTNSILDASATNTGVSRHTQDVVPEQTNHEISQRTPLWDDMLTYPGNSDPLSNAQFWPDNGFSPTLFNYSLGTNTGALLSQMDKPPDESLLAFEAPMPSRADFDGLSPNRWLESLGLANANDFLGTENIRYPVDADPANSNTSPPSLVSTDSSALVGFPDEVVSSRATLRQGDSDPSARPHLDVSFESSSQSPDDELSSAHTEKRTKKDIYGDVLSACWTSPLCPHQVKDGKLPNAATCDGACVSNLFATLTEPEQPLNSEPLKQSPLEEDKTSLKRAKSGHLKDEKTSSATQVVSTAEYSTCSTPVRKGGKANARVPHKQVERKYRDSLNNQLERLRQVIPTLRQPCDPITGETLEDDRLRIIKYGNDIEDQPALPENKPSKATILSSAITYIQQLEADKARAQKENEVVKQQVARLQRLVRCDDCELLSWVRNLKISSAPMPMDFGGEP